MVEVASPAFAKERHDMAGLQPHEEGLSITHSHSSTFSLPSRSKTMNRGAGCLKGARPDLWGAGEGDFPRLPDHISGVIMHQISRVFGVKIVIWP